MLLLHFLRVAGLGKVQTDIWKIHQRLKNHICKSVMEKDQPSHFATILREKVVPMKMAGKERSIASC